MNQRQFILGRKWFAAVIASVARRSLLLFEWRLLRRRRLLAMTRCGISFSCQYSFLVLTLFGIMMVLISCRAKEEAVHVTSTQETQRIKRTFEVMYTAKVTDIPDDAKIVDLWLPLPQSDANQDISDLEIECEYPYEEAKESTYGNSVLHVRAVEPAKTFLDISITFKVLRYEERHNVTSLTEANITESDKFQEFLQPNNLVVIDDEIRTLARKVVQGKKTVVEKAGAIYDYVLETMKYDKTGKGWGRGDTKYACRVKKGNCSDFHSLFISLARACGIAAKFEIGFPIPAGTSGKIGGYHCWARFYVPGHGWVPVDISEADKHPEQARYFFGNICENRVEFSQGRDLTLVPAQQGAPLNFFIYPYVEIDSTPFSSVEKVFSFKEI